MTYAELCTAIQDYTENSFTVDQLNTFIQQTEQRIYNTIQLPDLRKNVTGTLSAHDKYLQCPTDLMAVHSLAAVDTSGNYSYLLNKDVNYLREAYPLATTEGEPRYYALFGPRSDNDLYLTFIVAPTPDADYSAELHYFAYPESIVTASSTWLGETFDSALLYGSITEAYIFMKGTPELMAAYRQQYTEAMALLKQLGDGKDRRDSYRSGQVRFPVQ
jgi:hypothetical protein